MKERILQLRQEGKSYDEIVELLRCSKSTVSYHCNPIVREAILRRNREKYHDRKLAKRITQFRRRNKGPIKTRPVDSSDRYGVKQVLERIGANPKCYITGKPIDILDTSSWTLDHIVPVCKGGPNSLDNMGLCLRQINEAKGELLLEEFVQLCRDVIANT